MMKSTSAAADTQPAVVGSVNSPTFAISRSGEIKATPATQALLESVGGPNAIIDIVAAFYQNFHADVYLRQFLGGLQQPLQVHATRLGLYISEQMGATGAPWTKNCKLRAEKEVRLATGEQVVVRDRFTAHYCAWNSVDRPKELAGRRFKLDDCRVWMRLFFWAVRSQGYSDDHPLFRYLQKFVAHFIAIYEQTARSFTLAESRWSAKPENIAAYIERGRYFEDVVAVPLKRAITTLPEHEHDLDQWLYDGSV